ncbi:MAG: DCC1-like thiol-disulfide oxidoreductase family protein [Bacteroidota bacterium]
MANHTFLYDDACPMCQAYTGAFKHLKWSDRKAFSSLKEKEWPKLDLDRGRHEIPLLDKESGEIRYGLDAMTTVMANAMPALRPLLRSRLLLAILKPLYWLITYNRRVIAGTHAPATGIDCAPDYHRGWRWTYVILAFSAAALIGLPISFWGIAGLSLIVGLMLSSEQLTYLGHLSTVALGTACLYALIPGWLGITATCGFVIWQLWHRLR